MMNGLLMDPGMPRIFTALAEWISCIICIYPVKQRFGKGKTTVLLLLSGGWQILIQELVGKLPFALWIPGTILTIISIWFVVYICCAMNAKDATYWCANILIMSEMVASVEWQIYCFAVWNGFENSIAHAILVLTIVYILFFTLIFILELRIVNRDVGAKVTTLEMLTAVFTALISYFMSNIGFVINSVLSGNATGRSLLYIRTLVDICGFCILYIQQLRRYDGYLHKELQSIHYIFQQQYEQYQTYKKNNEFIKQKCHDLKHQINIIRLEKDADRQEAYLKEMEQIVKTFNADIVTGNGVLDTILTGKNLYCIQNDIKFTCIADGSLLGFMETLDICSIFGNALDNAIEYVEKNLKSEKRLIRLRIFAQNSFLIINIENYCEEKINLEDGFPVTTKKDKKTHGYGLKSIQYTVEKYGGTMTLHTENSWFIMRILVPIKQKDTF